MKTGLMVSLVAVFALSGLVTLNAQVSEGSKTHKKSQLVERIRTATPIAIQGDNPQAGPLQIQEARVKEISEYDFTQLTGEPSKNSNAATTFPDVTLLNTSTKTIKSFAIAVRNVVDTRSGFDVLYQHHVSILPGANYEVVSDQWLKAEKRTVKEGGQFVTRSEKPGLESPKAWISGAASELRVAVAIVDFDDGSRWIRPKD
ncbi:MAG: hypothetical protein WAV47_00040 [Blastocatellia bacterium]